MARPVAFPRAKALVRKAKIENPDLTATKAMGMLEPLSKKESRQVKDGERLTDESVGFPLVVPTSTKTIARWMADIPKSRKWNARSNSPTEFRVIARVFRELVARGVLKRMLTQAEADYIARVETVTPGKSPLTLLAIARMLIALEGIKEAEDSVTSWLVFSVEDSPDRKHYPARDWLNAYARLPDVEYHGFPNLYLDIYRLNEELKLLEDEDD